MRQLHRTAQRFLVLAICLLATLTPAEAAIPLSPPTGISVSFSGALATIDWNAVSGSQGYAVVIRPLGSPLATA
jgi:hypothetical protein